MELRIRPLRADETPLLRECMERLAAYHNSVAISFAGFYPIMPIDTHLKHIRDHIINRTAMILGLFQPDGALCGFGMASFEDAYGEIDYLFVDEVHRGDGWGGILLEELLDFLRGNDVNFVDLNMVQGNPAKSFYEKFGFQPRSEVMSMEL